MLSSTTTPSAEAPLSSHRSDLQPWLAFPERAELLGALVGGHRIESVLAEGGVGIVYVARDFLGRAVAFKVLQLRHAADVGMVARFEREIAYLQRVDHPNVIAVRSHGRLADGRPWFTMDLLHGSTLGELIRAEGGLPLPRALAIADQLLAGLGALHQARVVHRDLQPGNVFVAQLDDGVDRVVLLDFGFAQEPGFDVGDGVTTDSPGALVGTLAFMSPEQATRSRAITAQSDLFAVGLLLYYALAGKLPFRGKAELDVLVSIIRAAPVPLRRERRDVPAALDAILSRAFAKHPDARYRGAAEMRTALRCMA